MCLFVCVCVCVCYAIIKCVNNNKVLCYSRNFEMFDQQILAPILILNVLLHGIS